MRMRWVQSVVVVTAVVAGLVAGAAPATAFDLNGTWSGKITCKGIFNGARSTVSSAPTLLVDDGASLALAVDGVHYSAVAFPDAAKPDKGEIAVIRCGTTATVSGAEFGGEFGRMKVTTKTGKIGASISGTTFQASILLAPTLYTCRWSFKRATLARPPFEGCTPPPVS